MEHYIIKSIINTIQTDKQEALIKNFEYNKCTANELLFFLKPECFLASNPHYIVNILEMILLKFKQHCVDISGILYLGGKRIKELGIMERHYGLINTLSRRASRIVRDDDLLKIQQNLRIDDLRNYELLGGHEFLAEFGEFTEDSLDNLWIKKKSIKLRSGFYFQMFSIEGRNIIIINGFHPAQLKHYTNHMHITVIFSLHTNTDWAQLRNNLVGTTFPEAAMQGSIREEIFNNNQKYGISSVSVSNNCVHLSAGPFEALFEINNFFNDIQLFKFQVNNTNIFRLMIESGCDKEDIKDCLLNPIATINNKQADLFTFTECKNSTDAISEYLRYFKKNRIKNKQR